MWGTRAIPLDLEARARAAASRVGELEKELSEAQRAEEAAAAEEAERAARQSMVTSWTPSRWPASPKTGVRMNVPAVEAQ